MQLLFLRHHKGSRHWTALTGLCFPVTCCRSTRANTPAFGWVNAVTVGWVTLPLQKKGGIPTHPPLKRKTPNTENSQMISEIQLMFQVSGFSKERLHVDFFC